jgi:polyphosphate kinase
VTARTYEDLGLLTADPDLGADLSELFNHLTGFSREPHYRRISSRRQASRPHHRAHPHRGGAPDGRIVIKMNNLSDPAIIDALYEASAAGVEIDLIVRGICCLRPGVPGLSENIRVRSILGRFLEHSRIFRFGSEARGYEYLIGSADLMPRNLDRRVEVLAPIRDPALQKRIEEILQLLLEDDRLAWQLEDDVWRKVPVVRGLDAQAEMQRRALERT